jgi:hypothetical protein
VGIDLSKQTLPIAGYPMLRSLDEGRFSPRVEDSLLSLSTLPSVPSISKGEPIDAVVPLVLLIMPELEDLCASTALALPLSVEHMKVDSKMTLS